MSEKPKKAGDAKGPESVGARLRRKVEAVLRDRRRLKIGRAATGEPEKGELP